MKRFSSALPFALLTAFSFTSNAALAGHRCDAPNGMIEQRACAKAAEGPDALRHFVERTRSIYGLYYFDYARAEAIPARPVPVAVVGVESSTPSPTLQASSK